MKGGEAAFEDDKTHDPGAGTRKDVTRYALGARGGDMVETGLSMGLAGERTARSYPLYDGHGNMVAQVARAEDEAPGGSFVSVPGAPQFELGARRKYDAWGQVRWTEGQPADQGYCASLQHRRDAESGLVYMRARYYEPWTGRFISEDPAMDGANWYVFCGNEPVSRRDATGRSFFADFQPELWWRFLQYAGRGSNDAYAFLIEARDIMVDWASIAKTSGDELFAAGTTAYDAAKALLAGTMQEIQLQLAIAMRNRGTQHWTEARLIASVGMAQIATMAWLLGIDGL
ncbi:MAG: RHS repeat-associated core domain-containing protein [Fimbriimonadaceae bacterium]|nr:RHS repeat-associated core domain-containing protein [Fimbriimonadaceae bacterium]QYK58959.1 MAG: RHS repeat-associated core domain-containing protein [Fimbriimonadaceae bacterium]